MAQLKSVAVVDDAPAVLAVVSEIALPERRVVNVSVLTAAADRLAPSTIYDVPIREIVTAVVLFSDQDCTLY